MSLAIATASELLIGKLLKKTKLPSADIEAIEHLPWRTDRIVRGTSIVRRGQRPTRCFLLVNGFVVSSKQLANGLEPVTGLHVAGDMPDLFGLHLETMDTDMWAASDCTVAFVDHAPVKALCSSSSVLNAGLWRFTLEAAAITREWVVNVGHRQARPRLAHLFCEVLTRLSVVERAPELTCDFPFTQASIGDITGMSVVHVNRSLKELRSARLISFSGGVLSVLDWSGLAAEADFEEDYLHLSEPFR